MGRHRWLMLVDCLHRPGGGNEPPTSERPLQNVARVGFALIGGTFARGDGGGGESRFEMDVLFE